MKNIFEGFSRNFSRNWPPCYSVAWPCYSVAWPCYGVAWPCYSVAWPCQSVAWPCYSVAGPWAQGPYGPIWALGPWSSHAITRPGHALTRPGHAITRPGHAITRPGHAITRPGHAITRRPVPRKVPRKALENVFHLVAPFGVLRAGLCVARR